MNIERGVYNPKPLNLSVAQVPLHIAEDIVSSRIIPNSPWFEVYEGYDTLRSGIGKVLVSICDELVSVGIKNVTPEFFAIDFLTPSLSRELNESLDSEERPSTGGEILNNGRPLSAPDQWIFANLNLGGQFGSLIVPIGSIEIACGNNIRPTSKLESWIEMMGVLRNKNHPNSEYWINKMIDVYYEGYLFQSQNPNYLPPVSIIFPKNPLLCFIQSQKSLSHKWPGNAVLSDLKERTNRTGIIPNVVVLNPEENWNPYDYIE